MSPFPGEGAAGCGAGGWLSSLLLPRCFLPTLSSPIERLPHAERERERERAQSFFLSSSCLSDNLADLAEAATTDTRARDLWKEPGY